MFNMMGERNMETINSNDLIDQENAKPRQKRKTKKSILLIHIFVSIIFCLIIAEIFLRICVEQEVKRNLIYDEELGWRGEPHGSGVYIRNIDQIYVPFEYNDLGFRDEDVALLDKTNVNILFLGDSFVESLEVEYNKTFHKLTENKLKQTYQSPVDIINISSQGYSTAQELIAYRRYKNS